ncbi:MAG: carbohydrate kinase family protein [Suipraeoptans sp.]
MYSKGISLAGNLIADIGYTIDAYPDKGNLAHISNPINHTGGMCNILIDLARLDDIIPLMVSGRIGDDENGEFILNSLKKYGNINGENIHKNGRTAITYVMNESGDKERTFFYDPGNSTQFCIDDIDFEKIKSDIFILEYLLTLGTLDEPDDVFGTKAGEVLARAKECGMKTVIDMVSEDSSRYETVVRPTLKYVDYYISNEVEASGVVGEKLFDEHGVDENKIENALHTIKNYGVNDWIIIHSPKCGYGLDCRSNKYYRVPSMKLPKGYIKGKTGAGDAFCAGIVYAAYRGMNIGKALKLGAKCAAQSLSEEDSNSGIRNYADE